MDSPTAAHVAVPTSPPATAEALISQVSHLRYRVDLVTDDVTSLGREVYGLGHAERTAVRERQSAQTLLEDLARRGLGWSSIARLVGVSVPAVRKWRLGEGASPENRQFLAKLAGLMDMLEEQFMIEDPAAWLEIPLPDGHTLVDVVARGRVDIVLEYAAGWIRTPSELLDQVGPGWRASGSKSEFETFIAADGQPAIRPVART